MKRSKMLSYIKDALYCHLPGYKECPDFIVEAVLQTIEGGNPSNEGMLPPPYTCINEANPAPTSIGSCKLHEWEPEDET